MRGFRGKMKKILVKMVGLIAICLAIISIYNIEYVKIALFESNPNFSISKFKNVPEEIDYCNFGNSLAVCAFGNYEQITGECFNFALSAQSLSYDYRIMQQYRNRLSDGTTVFITLNYSCFAVDEQNESNFEAKNERYYYFLEPKHIKNCSMIEYGIIKTYPVLWQTPVTIIQKWQTFRRERKPDNSSEKPNFKENAEGLFSGRKVLGDNGTLIVVREELDSLLGMIKCCHEQGAKPVIVLTPYRKEYTDLFSDDFYDQYYELLDDICESENCELFDLSHNDYFSFNDKYFSDAYHLTTEGSKAFLSMIKKKY